MLPTYKPGDTLLGWRYASLKEGRVVVVRRGPLIIKRLVRLGPATMWIEGDNATQSTDSRQFGPVDRRQVVAVIIAKL